MWKVGISLQSPVKLDLRNNLEMFFASNDVLRIGTTPVNFLQDLVGLLAALMGGEPSRTFGNEKQADASDKRWDDLKDERNSPVDLRIHEAYGDRRSDFFRIGI